MKKKNKQFVNNKPNKQYIRNGILNDIYEATGSYHGVMTSNGSMTMSPTFEFEEAARYLKRKYIIGFILSARLLSFCYYKFCSIVFNEYSYMGISYNRNLTSYSRANFIFCGWNG